MADVNGESLLEVLLAEDTDLEFKAAQGRDGRGELPKDFWESYSAMANTFGGTIVLGVEEKPRGKYRVIGIVDYARVKKQLWDCLNDRDKVSTNLLLERHVQILEVDTIDGRRPVLKIEVPRATRHQRPVHLTKNPIGNTYLRRAEGDYRADDEAVRRMFAERVEDERDARILKGFGINDLDQQSLQRYRVEVSIKRPNHVWANLPTEPFLRNLGAFRRDRESAIEGLTAAGLLMFGRLPAIREQFGYFELDYQERSEPSRNSRWVDRFTTDGSWSGNLYDFYRAVIQRLFDDLKVPFVHDGMARTYQTPIHEALQEALTNTLIHADYSGRISVLVVKSPDLFGFRNPGMMRIPLRDALAGGQSDCRNRIIQTMFQLVGLGDKAGSGVPTILRNWTKDQHFRLPLLEERAEPEQTLLTLPRVSLIPHETRERLISRFGQSYLGLPDLKRLALATAELEGSVSHSRLSDMAADHPADLSACLRELVSDGYLQSQGHGRGKFYQLSGNPNVAAPLDFSSFPVEPAESAAKDTRKEHETTPDMPHLRLDMPLSGSDMPPSGGYKPEILEGSDQWKLLLEQARSAREERKADLAPVILILCRDNFLTKSQLMKLLNRSEKTLRNNYLGPLVKTRKLVLRFPEKPKARNQAYKSSQDTSTTTDSGE